MTTNINKQTYLGERGKANILLSSTVDGVFSITFEDDGIGWEMTMCRDDAMKIARKFAEMSGIVPIVRKGEWIRVEPTEEDIELNLVPRERIECSNCHLPNRHIQYDEYHDEMTVTYHNTHYCPNCGAKMSISEGKDV